MTPKEITQNGETVVAIWNKALTLKICLDADIVQEETPCECTANHHLDDADDELFGCDGWAWPPPWGGSYDGPSVVPGDGVAHFCDYCVREVDPEFVDAYVDAFNEVCEAGPHDLADWMEQLAVHFPPGVGIIERSTRRVDC